MSDTTFRESSAADAPHRTVVLARTPAGSVSRPTVPGRAVSAAGPYAGWGVLGQGVELVGEWRASG